MLASAAGRELAAALATLEERASEVIDIDANAAAPHLPAAWTAYLAAARSPKSLASLREAAAACLDALPCDIHFTAGGTEADILGLVGTLAPGDKIVASPIEHAALAQMLAYLQRSFDIEVVELPLDCSGVIDTRAIDDCVVAGVKLVVCMAANNETGIVQPLAPLAKRCEQIGAILHVDAVQAFGRMPTEAFLRLPGRTMVALAGHKLGATGHTGLLRTQGVLLQDALGIRAMAPLFDEENVSGVASLIAALTHAKRQAGEAALASLRDDVEQQILSLGYGARIIGKEHQRLYNTSCIFWPDIEAEAVLMGLDARNIAIGAGAACSSGSTEASPTLLAMGMTPFDARCCVRLSYHVGMSLSDAKKVIAALGDVLAKISFAQQR